MGADLGRLTPVDPSWKGGRQGQLGLGADRRRLTAVDPAGREAGRQARAAILGLGSLGVEDERLTPIDLEDGTPAEKRRQRNILRYCFTSSNSTALALLQ